jgi:hypothetical protein
MYMQVLTLTMEQECQPHKYDVDIFDKFHAHQKPDHENGMQSVLYVSAVYGHVPYKTCHVPRTLVCSLVS